MAASTNVHGFNIGGNNNSFDQRGHFYRGVFSGNVTGMLVKQNSTPNMTVLVEHGSALLNKNTTSASVAEIKSDTSVTIDTANTSNPRIDTVVIYEDTSVAIPTVENDYWQDGAGGRFKLVSLPGTAAASPVALSDASVQTAIGAGKPWTRLADVTVPTNSTTIINSNISDKRNKIQTPLTNLNGGTTAGVLVTSATGDVTVQGAWTAWTPTLTNITLGNGTLVAKYSQVGKTVKYKLSFTMGTTSAMGTVPKFTLPVTAAAIAGTSNGIVIGRGSIWDFGINNFDAIVVYETTTLAAMRVLNAASTNVVQSNITSTNPMTWTSTDELHVSGEYEAA